MVSHNKRIVAALAAVAAMGIGLAGCGGSDTAGDTKPGSDGGVVNITYMHRLPDSEGMTLVNDIVAKWNKEHPNIQVKATKFDGNAADMIKKLETTSRLAMRRIWLRSVTPRFLRSSPRAFCRMSPMRPPSTRTISLPARSH